MSRARRVLVGAGLSMLLLMAGAAVVALAAPRHRARASQPGAIGFSHAVADCS